MMQSRRVVWLLFILSFVLRAVEQTRFTLALNRTMLAALWFFSLLDFVVWATRKLRERKER